MEGVYIGLDLCDGYSRLCPVHPGGKTMEELFPEEEKQLVLPTTLCKCRGVGEWRIGERAYETALMGNGIMVDKLMRLVSKEGTATLEGVCYQAADLLYYYLSNLLAAFLGEHAPAEVDGLVVTLRELDVKTMDAVMEALEKIGISREKIRIISHTEAYLFYLLRQPVEILANMSCLFDLSEDGMTYFECRLTRGVKPQICYVTKEELEEGFNLNILDTPQGMKLADSIMYACGDRMLGRKVFSSVYLSGKGFAHVDRWQGKFLPFLCARRRVFYEGGLFAKGAALMALWKNPGDYIFVCEGRITTSVFMDVIRNGVHRRLILAEAGMNWYEAKNEVDLILENTDPIRLELLPAGQRNSKTVLIPLDSFPVRPSKTTRVSLKLQFTGENQFHISVKDRGFGSFFPSTDVEVEKDIPVE